MNPFTEFSSLTVDSAAGRMQECRFVAIPRNRRAIMKQFSITVMVVAVLGTAVAIAVNRAGGFPGATTASAPPAQSKPAAIQAKVEERNPWTSLNVNNKPQNFQFAIVTDRTGGRRPGIFSEAVGKINLLQPEFVMSVGDLIEGYNTDPGMWALEWSELESKVADLQMPFFFCAGNHDITNLPMSDEWKRKFGRSYYEFRYQDVLFLVLNTEDKTTPLKKPDYFIGEEQQKWVADVLKANRDVRWTFVFLHKPTWTYPNADHRQLGWKAVEDALQGRKYTVFAGHKHNYGKFIRKGMEYYMLATTGGATKLQGISQGQFDHFVWVTMKVGRPVIANLLLDGIADSNVRRLPLPKPSPKKPGKRKPKQKKPVKAKTPKPPAKQG